MNVSGLVHRNREGRKEEELSRREMEGRQIGT